MASSGKILYILKRFTQLVISVSVVSLLYSHSSLVPLFLESYDYILSFKLFTYRSERNYIFLLCNGILVLIIQTSGLISKITPLQSKLENDQTTMTKPKVVEIPKEVEVFEEEKVRDDMIGDDHRKEEDDENIILVDVQEDDHHEEGIDHELNTKCEDFIKKMKQQLRGA